MRSRRSGFNQDRIRSGFESFFSGGTFRSRRHLALYGGAQRRFLSRQLMERRIKTAYFRLLAGRGRYTLEINGPTIRSSRNGDIILSLIVSSSELQRAGHTWTTTSSLTSITSAATTATDSVTSVDTLVLDFLDFGGLVIGDLGVELSVVGTGAAG